MDRLTGDTGIFVGWEFSSRIAVEITVFSTRRPVLAVVAISQSWCDLFNKIYGGIRDEYGQSDPEIFVSAFACMIILCNDDAIESKRLKYSRPLSLYRVDGIDGIARPREHKYCSSKTRIPMKDARR